MRQIKVCIYQGYEYPNLYRQSRRISRVQDGINFTINDFTEPCDILVVLNRFYENVEIKCRAVWLVIQEPDVDMFPWIMDGHDIYDKIYSPFCPKCNDTRYILSHGALPWHVEMTYDQLETLHPPDKKEALSWITTNKTVWPGHKERMQFLEKLKNTTVKFDLFGHGFRSIKDKFDGLAPYRYSIAVENYSGAHYWTEKVADCFLSWTMPIYYGCTNLADYFPPESFVNIDIKSQKVFEQIQDVVQSDLYLKNRDAIGEARRLILNKYQLFPFLTEKIASGQELFQKKMKTRNFKPYRESFLFKLKQIVQKFL